MSVNCVSITTVWCDALRTDYRDFHHTNTVWLNDWLILATLRTDYRDFRHTNTVWLNGWLILATLRTDYRDFRHTNTVWLNDWLILATLCLAVVPVARHTGPVIVVDVIHHCSWWNKNTFPLIFCTGGVGNVYKTFLLLFHSKQTTVSDTDKH